MVILFVGMQKMNKSGERRNERKAMKKKKRNLKPIIIIFT